MVYKNSRRLIKLTWLDSYLLTVAHAFIKVFMTTLNRRVRQKLCPYGSRVNYILATGI